MTSLFEFVAYAPEIRYVMFVNPLSLIDAEIEPGLKRALQLICSLGIKSSSRSSSLGRGHCLSAIHGGRYAPIVQSAKAFALSYTDCSGDYSLYNRDQKHHCLHNDLKEEDIAT